MIIAIHSNHDSIMNSAVVDAAIQTAIYVVYMLMSHYQIIASYI